MYKSVKKRGFSLGEPKPLEEEEKKRVSNTHFHTIPLAIPSVFLF